MSRPEIPIDWEMVDQLIASGAPGTEVAAFFGMHPDTFYKRVESKFNVGFSEYLAKKRATGDALIRLHQYQKALGITKKGDNTLLIWLGKQRLGQKESPQDNVVNPDVLKHYMEVMAQIAAMQAEASKQKAIADS